MNNQLAIFEQKPIRRIEHNGGNYSYASIFKPSIYKTFGVLY